MADNNADILADEHAVEQAKDFLRQGNTVDFFEDIASRLLKQQPPNPVNFCLEIVQNKLEPKAGKADQDAEQAGTQSQRDDSRYMQKHNVSDFLDKWILALIAERPGIDQQDQDQADIKRLEFHMKYLQGLLEKKSTPT